MFYQTKLRRNTVYRRHVLFLVVCCCEGRVHSAMTGEVAYYNNHFILMPHQRIQDAILMTYYSKLGRYIDAEHYIDILLELIRTQQILQATQRMDSRCCTPGADNGLLFIQNQPNCIYHYTLFRLIGRYIDRHYSKQDDILIYDVILISYQSL